MAAFTPQKRISRRLVTFWVPNDPEIRLDAVIEIGYNQYAMNDQKKSFGNCESSARSGQHRTLDQRNLSVYLAGDSLRRLIQSDVHSRGRTFIFDEYNGGGNEQ